MNKIIFIILVLFSHQLFAEDLEPSSEVVDPLIPMEASENIVPIATEDEPEMTTENAQENPPATVAEKIVEPSLEPSVTEMKQVENPIATPAPVMTTNFKERGHYQPRKGHWVSTFGFEGMEYQVPLDYQGTHDEFEDEKRAYYGGRLGFGREFYLGLGFTTSTKIEGYYMGTLFETALSADPEVQNVEFAYTKKTGYMYGADIVQSLGFIFDMATKNPFMEEMTYLTVEPFVFAGIGRAQAYNRTSYHWETNGIEDYRSTTEDQITTASWGGGLNVTSITGFFLYLKATQYRLNITKREEETFSSTTTVPAGTTSKNTLTDVDVDPVTVYAIGGGYKF